MKHDYLEREMYFLAYLDQIVKGLPVEDQRPMRAKSNVAKSLHFSLQFLQAFTLLFTNYSSFQAAILLLVRGKFKAQEKNHRRRRRVRTP